MTERWLPVSAERFDHYLVSDQGRVRRSEGSRATKFQVRILKPYCADTGYLRVNLHCGGTRYKTFFVHRLVAVAFLGPAPPGKRLVCHRDDDKRNNCAENLFWGSHADNAADMVAKKRQCFGERHGFAKLTQAKVREIRDICASGETTQRDVAKLYGISEQSVSRVVLRQGWTSVA